MASTIQCEIVSAEESLYSGEIEALMATGSEGDLGIYPGHAPLLTKLNPGPVRLILAGGEEEIFYASGGMLEVQPKVVTLLADTAARAHDVDEAAAVEAKKRAEEALANQQSEMEYSTAAALLAEASAQLRTISQLKKKFGGR